MTDFPQLRGERSQHFTPREREVLDLLATGKRQAEIANLLVVSPRTIEAHVQNIREKTGHRNALELAVAAATGKIPL